MSVRVDIYVDDKLVDTINVKNPKKWDGNGRNYTTDNGLADIWQDGFEKGFMVGQKFPKGKLGEKVT